MAWKIPATMTDPIKAAMPDDLTTPIMIGTNAKLVALHHRQPGADQAEPDGLEQGGNTCKQHRHLDQEDHIGASKSKAGSAGNND